MPANSHSVHQLMNGVPEKPSVISVLEACSMLNALTDEERTILAKESYVAYAERGEYIWIADSPSHFVGVVGVGYVKMTRTTPSGSEVAVELLGPGQCFGLMAALEGRIYPLSACAVTHTWYLKIPTRAINAAYAANPNMKDQILRSIAPRLRKAHDMMARLSTGRIEQRLAAVLAILVESYGENVPEGVRLTVPLTRQDLAEMAGTTVETAIRVMSRWQKAGVLDTDHQVITITNMNLLNEALVS
ncbi:MAG: Crp/Fnr family transcriptional regulator [Fimbriimonadaceae bacterium]|nr:Crp/Fnr family transcriptional regulator [Fimbriimonadaceae bacterium]